MRLVRLGEDDYGIYDGLDAKGPYRTYLQYRGTVDECEHAVELYKAEHSWRVVRALTSWPEPSDVDEACREAAEYDRAIERLASCAV